MKKSFQILMVLVASMLFALSCSKEDSYKSKIVGEWQVEEGILINYGEETGSTVIFRAENIVSVIWGEGRRGGTYYISGEVLYLQCPEEITYSIKYTGSDVLELNSEKYGVCKLRRVKK